MVPYPMDTPQQQAVSDISTSTLATVTVTFNPTLSELQAQLQALPADCIKVFVDNGSQPELWAQVQELSSQFQNMHFIRSESNIGLAAATNLGAGWLASLEPMPDFLLILDQDSEPNPECISNLLHAFDRLQTDGHAVGCIGPLLADPDTGLTHGFHQKTRWRWTRAYPAEGEAPVSCANLNGSGTLVPLYLFQQLGGLDAELFIDHVDTEWAFRVLANGYSLWGIPSAVFKHSMGQASMRFWLFGWRVWPVRSPKRHYYLYRNAAILMKRSYIPLVWKLWAVVKLALTACVVTITGPDRLEQIKNMWHGIRQGLSKHAK